MKRELGSEAIGQLRLPLGGLYINGVQVTATASGINTGTVAGLTTTPTELNQLHLQGAVAADFAKLHAAIGTLIASGTAGSVITPVGAFTDPPTAAQMAALRTA